jgi:GH24 family phage-related lysozyme (muramidase)
MSVSEAGIQLIKSFEGCHNQPYKCPASLWTIGYGHVLYPDQARLKTPERASYALKPEHNRLWDADEIDSLLEKDLLRFSVGVRRLCPAVVDRQCHLDALVSFSYNCGLGSLQSSTLRMKFNRGDYDGAADEFLKWNKAGGKVLRGLERRREAERALFLSGG